MPADITSIDCAVNRRALHVLAFHEATTPMEGRFSVEYSLAVSAIDRKGGPAQYSADRVADPAVQMLAAAWPSASTTSCRPATPCSRPSSRCARSAARCSPAALDSPWYARASDDHRRHPRQVLRLRLVRPRRPPPPSGPPPPWSTCSARPTSAPNCAASAGLGHSPHRRGLGPSPDRREGGTDLADRRLGMHRTDDRRDGVVPPVCRADDIVEGVAHPGVAERTAPSPGARVVRPRSRRLRRRPRTPRRRRPARIG